MNGYSLKVSVLFLPVKLEYLALLFHNNIYFYIFLYIFIYFHIFLEFIFLLLKLYKIIYKKKYVLYDIKGDILNEKCTNQF